jgi:hypothetical protein
LHDPSANLPSLKARVMMRLSQRYAGIEEFVIRDLGQCPKKP